MNAYTVTVFSHDADLDFTDQIVVEAESQKQAERRAWAQVQEQRGLVTFDTLTVNEGPIDQSGGSR